MYGEKNHPAEVGLSLGCEISVGVGAGICGVEYFSGPGVRVGVAKSSEAGIGRYKATHSGDDEQHRSTSSSICQFPDHVST